jgi:hypothetical protein
MTRGLSCLLHGKVETAFLWNPLGFALFLGITIYLLYCVIVVAAKLPRLRWGKLPQTSALGIRIGVVILIALNWIYLIMRERALS